MYMACEWSIIDLKTGLLDDGCETRELVGFAVGRQIAIENSVNCELWQPFRQWLKWAGTRRFVGPQNRDLVFLGLKWAKFTKFLPEPWSLAAGTLFQDLEYWDSVGDRSLYLLVLRWQMCFEIYLLIFYQALQHLLSSFCIRV